MEVGDEVIVIEPAFTIYTPQVKQPINACQKQISREGEGTKSASHVLAMHVVHMEQIQMAGGKCVYVPLRRVASGNASSASWHLDMADLEAALTSRTRLVGLLDATHGHI